MDKRNLGAKLREHVMNRPHRKVTVVVVFDGDDHEDVMRGIERLARQWNDGRERIELPQFSTGPGGHMAYLIEDPEMTPERYVGELQAWVNREDSSPAHMPAVTPAERPWISTAERFPPAQKWVKVRPGERAYWLPDTREWCDEDGNQWPETWATVWKDPTEDALLVVAQEVLHG